ncbi:MAG: adenylate/guanylate cyclase domain-containing protein, partial [Bacteroidia bacterium]|nr:adenylate/guanylate cyclase domain-containing protein [Bacteroidia bacterium]
MSKSRQLAVIMFTDIVGYTALMGVDEEKAFRILNKNRELQKPIIEEFNGRWIKELGDGVMASFNTVSDSVNAAIKIQEESQAVTDLQLTIGIHLGEVVFENDDVFGDGVNIASRIQAISIPGSIYVSEAIHNNILNKQGIETKFVKQEELKNVVSPIRIYEVITDQKTQSSKISFRESNRESSGKSIAVLPFANMSNDPDQDYFCDGISEEIIDALAQLNNLRVIARTSAFSFKEKNIDVREIGKTLDVKTLLEGSVRKSGNRLRITTKLVSVSDGSHLWSNRYDRELEDIFSIQEDIATNVATELKGFLSSHEKKVIRPQKTVIEAYEPFLKGLELFHQLNVLESKIMYEKAIQIDPDYAPAHAGLS